MNKRTTLLILFVVFIAMGLVMYSHGTSKSPAQPKGSAQLASRAAPPPAANEAGQPGGFASPLQAPQGGNGGLHPIEPPIGVSPGGDGVPRPVTLAAGSDSRTLRLVAPSRSDDPAAREEEKLAQNPSTPVSKPEDGPAAQAGSTPPTTPYSGASGRGGMPGLTADSTPWDSPRQDRGAGQTGTPTAPPSGAVATTSPAPPASKPSALNPRQPAVTDPVTSEKPLSKTGAHTLRSISLGFAGQQMLLRIEAGAPFPVKTFALTGPDRLVVDLPGVWQGLKVPNVPENNVVSKARLGNQSAGSRLVLDLKGPLKNHTVERVGNRVDILVK